MQLNFHQDNGHGWLEVPIEMLKKMKLEKEISPYSYIDRKKGVAYLEEDCDMDTFWNKYKLEGELLNLVNIHSERSFIRDLPSYKAN